MDEEEEAPAKTSDVATYVEDDQVQFPSPLFSLADRSRNQDDPH